MTKEVAEKLAKETIISEAYLTALFWNNPENFNMYSEEQLNSKYFLNKSWRFYFQLGNEMFKRNIKKFDDVSVLKVLNELNIKDRFEDYGGFDTIDDVSNVVKDYEDNLESYYQDIKKYETIKQLIEHFGVKVIKKSDKYDYKKMTRDQIVTYWLDKINNIGLGTDNNYDEYDLLGNPEDYIKKVKEQADSGMPLYKSKLMNGITNGTHKGHVVMFGAFGNAGKTSFVFNKVVMAHIENKEKLLVIANEEEIKSFQDKLVITILSNELGMGINRKKLNQSNLTEEEEDKIRQAFARAKEMTDGDDSLIKFVFMENYIMTDVKKLIKYYHNRGYESVIIDTHKVSEKSGHKDRWVTFVEDMKEIYKTTRNNASGLNIRMWVNFQLADHAIKNRYLDFEAIGEGKAAKNEASVVQMFRSAWSDEYEGGSHAIECFKYVPDTVKGGYTEKKFMLEKGRIYYLLFNPKNRFGNNTETGQPVLVLEPNFNNNSWKELGWCIIANDKNR